MNGFALGMTRDARLSTEKCESPIFTALEVAKAASFVVHRFTVFVFHLYIEANVAPFGHFLRTGQHPMRNPRPVIYGERDGEHQRRLAGKEPTKTICKASSSDSFSAICFL